MVVGGCGLVHGRVDGNGCASEQNFGFVQTMVVLMLLSKRLDLLVIRREFLVLWMCFRRRLSESHHHGILL